MIGATISGFYGTGTPAQIFIVYFQGDEQGPKAYCVAGSCNINITCDEIPSLTNVETLNDIDVITCEEPIDCVYDLMREVESSHVFLEY